MANNTIMTAKNTFGDGLLMDFAPDNTQATCLTNALNATLVTMNGNELSLLNDMGNGRVETAYLPEGYVPVGTCEFGDIIYIVSYNPLINKSLIGCFPSPERNIDSNELEGESQILSKDDFIDKDGNITNKSVKKVLISNTLNPGDKYLIYANKDAEGLECLSDYGNTDHIKGGFPRELKLSIVAIEDSGRINYIDSNINWYNLSLSDYYILLNDKNTSMTKEDIDSYRTKVSSAYNIFLSKVSGKLAILAELESITSFSCSLSIYQRKETIYNEETETEKEIIKYYLYLNTSWTTDNNDVNPSGVTMYEYSEQDTNTFPKLLSEKLKFTYISRYLLDKKCTYSEYKTNCYATLTGNLLSLVSINNVIENSLPLETGYKAKDINGNNVELLLSEKGMYNDIILNNYYHKDISKCIAVFLKDLKDISNLLFNYKVCPFMTYGNLKEFSISNTIDFSKLGSGEITLKEWRYYKQGDIMHITFGLDIYEEEGKGVKEVSIEFYDNLGLAGRISLNNKNSYSGTFSQTFILGEFNNTVLATKIDGSQILHRGKGPYDTNTEDWDTKEDDANLTDLLLSGIFIKQEEDGKSVYYENDSGIIYPNLLYGVKILVYYLDKNSLGSFDNGVYTSTPKTFYRSMWTNDMYNDKYYDTKDFKDLSVNLEFSANSLFQEGKSFSCTNILNTHTSYLKSSNLDTTNLLIPYYSLGYNKYLAKGNLNLFIQPILLNNYDTFNLSDVLKTDESMGTITVRCGNKNITATDTSWISSKDSKTFDYLNLIKPNITNSTKTEIAYPTEISKDKYKTWIESLLDLFDLTLQTSVQDLTGTDYITSSGEVKNTKGYSTTTCSIKDAITIGVSLNIDGCMYSKITTNSFNSNYSYTTLCYRPFIESENDLADYNIVPTIFNVNDETLHTFGFNKSRYMSTNDKNAYINTGYETLLTDGTKTILQNHEDTVIDTYGNTTVNISDYLSLLDVDLGRFSLIDSGSMTDCNGSGRRGETYIRMSPSTEGTTLKFSSISNLKTWVNLFGPASDSDDNKIKNGYVIGDNYTGADGVLYLLVGLTKNGAYLCFNAFAKGFGNAGNRTLVFAKHSNNPTFTNVGGMYTFALYVASCLAKIYYLDASGTSQNATVLEDIITCTPYTETWKKDFVISFKFEDLGNVILIQKIPYSTYVNSFKKTMGLIPEELTLNSETEKLIINIEFEHKVDYNVTKLIDLYDYFNSNNVIMLPDITKSVSGLISLESTSDIMYLDRTNNTLVNDASLLPIEVLESDEYGNYKWKSAPNAILGKLNNFTQYLNITVDGIWAAQKSNSSDLYIHLPSSDDFNENNYFGFNSKLSIIPFNLKK